MEALFAAMIIAQLAEMRLAMRGLCKRVDTLEAKQTTCGTIIRTGLSFIIGASAYFIIR